MQYRKLGRSGIDVSVICLGTMTYGQQNTEAEGHEQMDYALDHGINFFDTAELYSIPPKPETTGSTERIIGTWLKARGNRGRVVLASKVVGRSDMTWFRADGSPSRLTRAQMTEALHGSLKRLQTDYLDLYQLHFPERSLPWGANPTQFRQASFTPAPDETGIAEQVDVLDGFVKAGLVRHVGLSNESAWGTMRFVFESETRGLARVQSIQNAYNLLNRTFETALAEVAMREDVGLLAYSPLAQGYLTGKYLDGARPPGTRSTLFNRGQRYEKPRYGGSHQGLSLTCEGGGARPRDPCARLRQQPQLRAANIVGATRMQHLKLAIASMDVTIGPELEGKIDAIHQLHGNPAPERRGSGRYQVGAVPCRVCSPGWRFPPPSRTVSSRWAGDSRARAGWIAPTIT